MPIKELTANNAGRDFVVGDLHGGYEALMACLDRVDFDQDRDRLIAVGDLIDRGSDSMNCLYLLEEHWFHSCMGNHEQMMLDALHAGIGSAEALLWFRNGGDWSLDYDWRELTDIVDRLRTRLHDAVEMPVGEQTVGVIHADVPDHDWKRLSRNLETRNGRHEALWSRSTISRLLNEPDYQPWINGIDQVVVGHTPLEEPLRAGNLLYVDTGAFLDRGYLTMVGLEEVVAGPDGDRCGRQ